MTIFDSHRAMTPDDKPIYYKSDNKGDKRYNESIKPSTLLMLTFQDCTIVMIMGLFTVSLDIRGYLGQEQRRPLSH